MLELDQSGDSSNFSPLKMVHLRMWVVVPLRCKPMNPLHNKLLGLLQEPLYAWWPLLALHYFLEENEHTKSDGEVGV